MQQIAQFFRAWWLAATTPLDAETNQMFGISDASAPDEDEQSGTRVAVLRPLTA